MPQHSPLFAIAMAALIAPLLAAEPAPPNHRKPKSESELRSWLENMVWHHRYTSAEIAAASRTKLARHKYECDMRTAAYCAAIEQIGKVYDLRGVFP